MRQVRTYDLVQKDKIFAIGYCFGGGAVLELMRSWPNTPGLLGEHLAPANTANSHYSMLLLKYGQAVCSIKGASPILNLRLQATGSMPGLRTPLSRK